MNKVKEKKTKKIDKLSAPETVADAPAEFGTVPKEEWSYDLPEGWRWEKLKSISDKIQYGFTESSSNERIGPKFLRITDIQNDNVIWEDVPYCKIDEELFEKFELQNDDIVIARTGATTGKSYLIKDVQRSVFASYLIRVSINKECALPKFIWNYMLSYDYWKQIEENINGIAQPGVNANKLSGLKIPLPPLPEQKRIVAKLESMLGKIKEARELIQEARDSFETRRAAILAKAFTGELTAKWRSENNSVEPAVKLLEKIIEEKKVLASEDKKMKVPTLEEMRIPESDWPYEVPEGWEWCKLNRLIKETKLGLVRNTQEQSNNFQYKYLKMNNITIEGDLFLDDLIHVNANDEEVHNFKLEKNDFLFNTRNSLELVGKNAVYNIDNEVILFNNNILRIRFYDFIDPFCTSYFLNSPMGKIFLSEIKSCTTNVAAIYAKDLYEISVPIPPLEEQKEIVRILDKLIDNDKEAKALIDLEDQLDLVEKSILSKAFRGDLTPGPSPQ